MAEGEAFTILDGDRATAVAATLDGERVLFGAEDLHRATGWELKPEGLCRGAVCVPVRDSKLAGEGGVDLVAFAGAVQCALALDLPERVAALAKSHALDNPAAGLQAPEFALPDLAGRVHRLSDWRGRKVLLAAYASW